MNSRWAVFRLPLFALLMAIVTGCQDQPGGQIVDPQPVAVHSDAPTQAEAQAPQVADAGEKQPTPAADDADYWDKITALYGQAKESGRTTATSASEWVADVFGNAVDSGSEAADATSRRVGELYEQAKARGETTATSAKDWVREDLQKYGAWEYKLVTLPTSDPEQLAVELNKLGAERWECYWVDKQGDQATFHLKKAGRSRLRQMPARDLLRLLAVFGLGTLSGDSGE